MDPNILQTAIDNSDVDEYTSMEQMRSKLENAKLRAQRYRQTMHGRDMASSQVIGKLKKEIRQLKEKNQSLLRRLEGRAEEVIVSY